VTAKGIPPKVQLTCPRCGNSDGHTIGGSTHNDRVGTWWCAKCEHVWRRMMTGIYPKKVGVDTHALDGTGDAT